MKTLSMDVFSEASNQVVVRHPGRAFPGSLIQGDTLYNLTVAAEGALRSVREEDYVSAEAMLIELSESLRSRLEHYKSTLREHSNELPFFESANGESK